MDHAEMDLADFVGVIIEECDDALLVGAAELEFLVHFAFDTREVGVALQRCLLGVLGIDVPADPQAAFGGEPLFTALLAAHIMQQPSLAVEERVGNDLLVRRVRLREVA